MVYKPTFTSLGGTTLVETGIEKQSGRVESFKVEFGTYAHLYDLNLLKEFTYPLVNVHITMENHHLTWINQLSMAMASIANC